MKVSMTMTDHNSMRQAYLDALHLGLSQAEGDLRSLVFLGYELLHRGDLTDETSRRELLAVLTACEALN